LETPAGANECPEAGFARLRVVLVPGDDAGARCFVVACFFVEAFFFVAGFFPAADLAVVFFRAATPAFFLRRDARASRDFFLLAPETALEAFEARGLGLAEADRLVFDFPRGVRAGFLRVVFFLATTACLRMAENPAICGK